MVVLPDGEQILRICVTVYTQYRRVTDIQTDRGTDGRTDILPRHRPRYAYASHGKNGSFLYLFVTPIISKNISLENPTTDIQKRSHETLVDATSLTTICLCIKSRVLTCRCRPCSR